MSSDILFALPLFSRAGVSSVEVSIPVVSNDPFIIVGVPEFSLPAGRYITVLMCPFGAIIYVVICHDANQFVRACVRLPFLVLEYGGGDWVALAVAEDPSACWWPVVALPFGVVDFPSCCPFFFAEIHAHFVHLLQCISIGST